MQQLVFLTLFLGLTSGLQSISLKATPDVKSIRIELGGRKVATLEQPPWSAKVDFGTELTPQNLVAIGFDGHGVEVARVSQTLNLPRPIAEVQIVFSGDDARPFTAQVVGTHRTHSPPLASRLMLDGVEVPVGPDFRATLPKVDWSRPHVLSAEMRFQDGQVARRETVIQGGLGDSVSSEVTPVAVTTEGKKEPDKLDGCFSADGQPLRAGPLERPSGAVVVVEDPDAREALANIHPLSLQGVSRWWERPSLQKELQLDPGTTQRILWPITREFSASEEPTYSLFEFSQDIPSAAAGMTFLLTRSRVPPVVKSVPRKYADAVAVAALDLLSGGRRRAVVLLVDPTHDASQNPPAVVRRFLERIGVPLFVWSAGRESANAAAAWGGADDISTPTALSRAVAKLNQALQSQRIVWIATDPLTALRVQGSDPCALKPLAHTLVAAPTASGANAH